MTLAFKSIQQVRDDNGLSILLLDFQQFRKLCDVELFYELLEEKKKPKEALLCMSAAVHKVQSEVFNHSLTL